MMSQSQYPNAFCIILGGRNRVDTIGIKVLVIITNLHSLLKGFYCVCVCARARLCAHACMSIHYVLAHVLACNGGHIKLRLSG